MCIRDSIWVDPGRDGWRIFEGGTGSTLPTSCREDDDEDDIESWWFFNFLTGL